MEESHGKGRGGGQGTAGYGTISFDRIPGVRLPVHQIVEQVGAAGNKTKQEEGYEQGFESF